MTAIQRQHAGKLGPWRFGLWAALASALIFPLVAMQFTIEVRWDAADFAAAAALLGSLGAAVELAFFLSRQAHTRALLIGASLIAVVLIWADAAVSVF